MAISQTMSTKRAQAEAAKFKGVQFYSGRFRAHTRSGGNTFELAACDTAKEAALAYDDAMRKSGRRVVNFPRRGTNEVQAVKGEKEHTTLRNADAAVTLRNAVELSPPCSGPLPTLKKHFKGVSITLGVTTEEVYRTRLSTDGEDTCLGNFCTEEEAARAYDDTVRKAGRTVVNFPRPGTNEVQAVKGEQECVTLQRHAAQQSTHGAGSGAAASSHGIASPPSKHSAASTPLSAPPVKRAVAHHFDSAGGSAALNLATPVQVEEAAVAVILPGVPPPLWDFYAAL